MPQLDGEAIFGCQLTWVLTDSGTVGVTNTPPDHPGLDLTGKGRNCSAFTAAALTGPEDPSARATPARQEEGAFLKALTQTDSKAGRCPLIPRPPSSGANLGVRRINTG